MLIVIKIVAPGSIATVKSLFFPSGGESLIASQRTLAGDPTLISGRANLVPRIIDGMRRPILGQGVGTRQTGDTQPPAQRPDPRQPVARSVPRRRPARPLRMGLADRPVRSSARSRRPNEGKPRRLARGGVRRIHHGLRRRDDHLRLARVRPGDIRLLDDPGARCDAHRSSSGDRALPRESRRSESLVGDRGAQ